MTTYSTYSRFAFGFGLGSLAFVGLITGWALNPSCPAPQPDLLSTLMPALLYSSVIWIPFGAIVGLLWALVTSSIRCTKARTLTGYMLLLAAFAATAVPVLVNGCPVINF